MIRDIAGRQNHSVKLARKLQRKNFRREHGLMVGEGMDLLRAAVDAGVEVRDILVRRELVADLPQAILERATSSAPGSAGGVDIGVCDLETLGYASSLGGSADVIFMCRQPSWSLADLDLEAGVTLVLAGAGDPGNVGTLVRACAAFACSGVISTPGTADAYSPKALRAGMGGQFLVRVVTEVEAGDLRAKVDSLVEAGGSRPELLVADAHQGEDVRKLQVERGVLVILGAERERAGQEWGSLRKVTIPQQRFDSLNVAMAGTILLYELSHRLAGKWRGGPLA